MSLLMAGGLEPGDL